MRTQKEYIKEVKQTKVIPRSKQEPTCLSHSHPSAPNFLHAAGWWHEHQTGNQKTYNIGSVPS